LEASRTPHENELIERLPETEKKQFLALCEPFELVLSAQLSVGGAKLSHAYFPRTGFISLVMDITSHPPLEVGMIGNEAMLGSELALGLTKTPWRALVQGEGSSWRIESKVLRKAMDDMPALEDLIRRTLMVRLHQQALASVCEHFHPIEQRMARWLLMSQDRAHANLFYVTQEFISLVLGVRRGSVNKAAADLRKDGLIEYTRGQLKVLDRAGLELKACTCYEADKLLHNILMTEQN
jgi:CRP-like cAMP-binding protein